MSFRPEIQPCAASWELGWPSRSGHGTANVPEELWGCEQPSASLGDRRGDTGRGWQRDLPLSFCDRQGWAGGRQPPEVPGAPKSARSPQQHLSSAPDASPSSAT